MDIDKLEAGCEMDALVAERVMPSIVGKYPYYSEHYGKGYVRTSKYSKAKRWSPSTDIAAAWLVEERIEELGLIEEYCMQLNRIANNTWDWRDGVKNALLWQLIHATPEDRCRAAWKAVETEGR